MAPIPQIAQLFLLTCLAFSVLLPSLNIVATAASHSTVSSPWFFVFGSSLVDPGTNAVVMPFRSHAEFYPYGSDYFEKPVGRWSNGRTFMDIISQSLGLGFLDPFVKSMGANFTHGVNFASSGSTAQNTSASSISDSGGLFSLLVQVEQFREYQNWLLYAEQDLRENSKLQNQISNSIYFFEIAHNDYLQGFSYGENLEDVMKLVLSSMRQAFEALYTLGARTFIVMNAVPLGCAPAILSRSESLEKDEYNCTSALNEIVSMHNENLEKLLNESRSEYPKAQWILFDAYNIFLDGYINPSSYGITHPFQACCGAGGTYNCNSEVRCGEAKKYINGTYVEATKCKDPSLYLIWDGLHPTESFSKHIARGFLCGTHLIPSFNVTMINSKVGVVQGVDCESVTK